MRSRLARTVLTVAGAVAVLLGLIWMGQGANLIPGSFMTGDRNWLGIGIFVAAAGVVALVFGVRRPKGD
jgi:hypothetical protein